MITEWRFVALLITTDRTIGDSLYGLLRAFPSDPLPEESAFSIELSPNGYAASMLCKQSLIDAIDEYNSVGYPQALLDSGMTEIAVDAIRGVIKADYYDLYATGERVVDSDAMANFLSANGYSIA